MSGGYTGIECEDKATKTKTIRPLQKHEHQVIVITIKGETSETVTKEWNDFIKQVKPKFGGNIIAVTLDGALTPTTYRGKPKTSRGKK